MLFADKDMLLLQSRAGNGKAGSMEREEERGEQTKVRVELMLPGFAECQGSQKPSSLGLSPPLPDSVL